MVILEAPDVTIGNKCQGYVCKSQFGTDLVSFQGATTFWISGKVAGVSITLTIGWDGLAPVSIEMGEVFGYDEVSLCRNTVYGFKWEISGHAQ